MDLTNLTPKPMRKGKTGKRGVRYYDNHGRLVAKTCARCDEAMPTDSFAAAKTAKDGLSSSCRDCASRYQKEYHTSGPVNPDTRGRVKYKDRSDQDIEKLLEDRYPDGKKSCSECEIVKDLEEFYHNKSNASVVSSMCKKCTKARAASRIHRLAQEDPDYYKNNYRKYKEVWAKRTKEEMAEARNLAFPGGTRVCSKCKEKKDLSRYSVVPEVRNATAAMCYDCKNEHARKNQEPEKVKQYQKSTRTKRKNRTTQEISDIQQEIYPNGAKQCPTCGVNRSLKDFSIDSYSTDGLRRNCRPCASIKSRDRYRKKYESHWKSHNIPFECYICQGPYEHSDHVIPTKLGGSDDPTNRLPICAYHNGSKNGALLEDWLTSKHHDIMADVLDKVVNVYNVEISPLRK